MTYQQILAAALKLDADERADLADLLWISVDHPENVAAAWVAEAERRVDVEGETKVLSPEEILAELRSRFADKPDSA